MSTEPPQSAPSTLRAERARWVSEAVHSVGMEGLTVSDEWNADAAELEDGRIDAAELVRRTRSRFGLPDRPETARPLYSTRPRLRLSTSTSEILDDLRGDR